MYQINNDFYQMIIEDRRRAQMAFFHQQHLASLQQPPKSSSRKRRAIHSLKANLFFSIGRMQAAMRSKAARLQVFPQRMTSLRKS